MNTKTNWIMKNLKFEQLKLLLKEDRSTRRFKESILVGENCLKQLVDLTRYCASGRNLQPLRYRIVLDEEERKSVFESLLWASYYKDWNGPSEGERPCAYLIQCIDKNLTNNLLCDDGLHLQSISLGATSLGLRGCIIKAFNKAKIIESLNIPENLEPNYVFALGYPAESVKIVDVNLGDIKYYRDQDDVQCVPKRALDDILIY